MDHGIWRVTKMTNISNPFSDSNTLSDWVVNVLRRKQIDRIAKWRMLEYWMQVELYSAVEYDPECSWSYLGEYEQPYFTQIPRPGSKHKTKWIDLVFVKPSLEKPEQIVWIELKDLGRSEHTLMTNAYGVGLDLAALFTIDPLKTCEIWKNPPMHVVDKGRSSEWKELSEGIEQAKQLIAQIVIAPRHLLNANGLEEQIVKKWLTTFQNRINAPKHKVDIADRLTDKFKVFAIVTKPLCELNDHHLQTGGIKTQQTEPPTEREIV
jgi:hypothetical protein